MTPGSIAVLVPTYKRPDLLLDTLESVFSQVIDRPFFVVVADNDAPTFGGHGAARAWAAARGHGERIVYAEAYQPGVAECRNSGFAAALAVAPPPDVIVMIDDDAVAAPGWLAAIVESWRRFDADLVAGPVVFHFADGVPAWMARMSPFRVVAAPSGLADHVRGTCNTLVARAFLERLALPYFDPQFAAGGEDVDFFERFRRVNARISWCAEAVVREAVPPDRSTEAWLRTRMMRAGHTASRMARKRHSYPRAVAGQMGLVIRAFAGSLIREARARDPGDRLDARLRRILAVGRFRGLFGQVAPATPPKKHF